MAVDRFAIVTGLPRSGTTVLAAVLEAHSRIELYFEPHNAHYKNPPEIPSSVADFRARMAKLYSQAQKPDVEVTGFKETSTTPDSLTWLEQTAAAMARELPVRLLWIVRDPVHAYLSRLDGARKWWGYPDAAPSEGGFRRYLAESVASLRRLTAAYHRYPGIIVSYGALAERPESVLNAIMATLSLPVEPEQLRYYERGPQKRKVMGDLNVARNPQPLSTESTQARDKERDEYREMFDAVARASAHQAPFELHTWIDGVGTSATLPDDWRAGS